jgi:hypothetical protein
MSNKKPKKAYFLPIISKKKPKSAMFHPSVRKGKKNESDKPAFEKSIEGKCL